MARRVPLVLVLIACLEDRIDVTGALCSLDRPCPSGWDCVNGTCAPTESGGAGGGGGAIDAGGGGVLGDGIPRLKNGDMERIEGSKIDDWEAGGGYVASVETAIRHGGSAALRLTKSDPGGNPFAKPKDPPVHGPSSGRRYCAAGWAYGTDAGAREVWLRFRELNAAGSEVAATEGTKIQVVDAWNRFRAEHVAQGQAALDIRVFGENPRGQDPLILDDVSVWLADGGTCE